MSTFWPCPEVVIISDKYCSPVPDFQIQERPSDKTPYSDPDLAKKLNEWEDHFCCPICMDRKKEVVFPCGHATCSVCVKTIKVCHMCRGSIDKTIHLY